MRRRTSSRFQTSVSCPHVPEDEEGDDEIQDPSRRLVPRIADQLDRARRRLPPDGEPALERVVRPLQPALVPQSLPLLLAPSLARRLLALQSPTTF